MKCEHFLAFVFSTLTLCACGSTDSPTGSQADTASGSGLAAVTAVTATGEPGSYTFSVTIESPDTGCAQYADWWEVFKADGTLVYRRILLHSHVNEQPFTRSGGPVNVLGGDDIIVRAHMNNSGYGEQVFRGSIDAGLIAEKLVTTFASQLSATEPLPDDCAF